MEEINQKIINAYHSIISDNFKEFVGKQLINYLKLENISDIEDSTEIITISDEIIPDDIKPDEIIPEEIKP